MSSASAMNLRTLSSTVAATGGISYTSGGGSTVVIPRTIDPFAILGVTPAASRDHGKDAFRQRIRTHDRQTRALVSLAYAIYARVKYLEAGDTTSLERAEFAKVTPPSDKADVRYTYNPSNLWTMALCGYADGVKRHLQRDPSQLTRENDTRETLLYVVSRSGFVDLVSVLLSLGAPVNHQQKTGSAALHAAAFFGHSAVIVRLLASGADCELKNRMPDHTPLDEVPKELVEVAELLRNAMKKIDPVAAFARKAQAEGAASGTIQNIEHGGRVVGVRVDHKQRQGIPGAFLHAWHGTKMDNVGSIFAVGLKKPGTKLSSSGSGAGPAEVAIPPGHIPKGTTVDGVSDWSNAVFVSPSILYAAHPAYAKRFIRCPAASSSATATAASASAIASPAAVRRPGGSATATSRRVGATSTADISPGSVSRRGSGELGSALCDPSGEWCALLHVMVRPNAFTAHPSTVVAASRKTLVGEPENPELRIDEPTRAVTEVDAVATGDNRPDALLRVSDTMNVMIAGVVFVRTDFLESAKLSFSEMSALLIEGKF